MKTTDFSEYIIRQRNIKIGAVAALIAAIAGNYLWTPEIGGAAFATFYLVVFALAILTVCIKSKKSFSIFWGICVLFSVSSLFYSPSIPAWMGVTFSLFCFATFQLRKSHRAGITESMAAFIASMPFEFGDDFHSLKSLGKYSSKKSYINTDNFFSRGLCRNICDIFLCDICNAVFGGVSANREDSEDIFRLTDFDILESKHIFGGGFVFCVSPVFQYDYVLAIPARIEILCRQILV